MRRRHGLGTAAGLAATLLVTSMGESTAQIPEEFTNLQLLPKDISRQELVGIMRDFAGALGVRCSHCHVGPDNLQGMDFATDDKAAKKTARAMIKMLDEINGRHLAKIVTGREERVEVKCQTCHHRLPVPLPIEDLIARKIEQEGIDAAVREYRALRDRHHGGASYDFTQVPVNALAERLANSDKLGEALALLAMNIEFNPDDAYTRILQGSVYRATGNRTEAIASFRKAIEIEPDNAQAKRELARMEADSE